jgi:hypothetical protein
MLIDKIEKGNEVAVITLGLMFVLVYMIAAITAYMCTHALYKHGYNANALITLVCSSLILCAVVGTVATVVKEKIAVETILRIHR